MQYESGRAANKNYKHPSRRSNCWFMERSLPTPAPNSEAKPAPKPWNRSERTSSRASITRLPHQWQHTTWTTEVRYYDICRNRLNERISFFRVVQTSNLSWILRANKSICVIKGTKPDCFEGRQVYGTNHVKPCKVFGSVFAATPQQLQERSRGESRVFSRRRPTQSAEWKDPFYRIVYV